jgi:CelD/BcsL family acetyltransferase involved in cellulose biosynthesis
MSIIVRLKKPSQLSPQEIQLWREWQRCEPTLESPYFRLEFTQAVARVRSDVEIAVLEDAGQCRGFLPLQRGPLGIGRPVGGKLSDYQGVIAPANLEFSAEQIVRGARLGCYDFDHLLASQTEFAEHVSGTGKSPYLDLTGGYEAYCSQRKLAGSDVVAKTMQKARKLEREVGPVEFVAHTTEPEVLQTLCAWKSAQYLETGLADLFAFPWTGNLLRDFCDHATDDFAPLISLLRIDSRPIAITYSLRSRGTVHAWFTAYDKELARYSPGAFLFLRMAQEAERLGITKIDLGKGDERYKWSLASGGTDLIEGSVRVPNVGLLLRDGWRTTRDWIGSRPTGKPAAAARWLQPLRQWFAFR